MNKLRTAALVIVAGCLPATVGAMDMNMAGHSSEAVYAGKNWMWLAPMSRDEMRAQRDKRKEAQKTSSKSWGEKSGEQKQHVKDGKKENSGASAYMRRVYFIRSGAFPKPMPARMDMPQKDAMSHDGMTVMRDAARAGAERSSDAMNKDSSGMGGTIVWVTSPDNSVESYDVQRRGPALSTSFPSGDGGWYSLFAYNDQGVKDGARVHLLSHVSYFGHGEGADEKNAPKVEGPGYYQGRPVLELERLCASQRECYRTTTGRELRVRASFKGQPLVDKVLTLTTQKGWRQTKRTDAHGKASFIMIKEDFPEDVDRRKSEDYLLTLEHTTDQMGMLDGQHYYGERYVVTLPLRVFPSPLDWESQSVAFQIIAGTVLVVGGAIAIRRKRRRKVA